MLIKCIDGFTRQFGAPADWDGKDMSCGVLPVLDVETGEGNFMFSAWEPTRPELEALNKGANIVLRVRGTAHPVVSLQVAADVAVKHPDDVAVDQFAEAMKAKLADARAKGRSGWQDCDPAELSYMLREHVEKGDPRDVANFCMFLWSLGKPIGDARPVVSLQLTPLDGIQVWIEAYTNAANGPHFMGHCRIVQLLSEYLGLRKLLAQRAPVLDLPQPWIRDMYAPEGSRDHFAADQMRDFFAQGFAAGRASQLSETLPPEVRPMPVAWRFREYDAQEGKHSSVWFITQSRADMEVYKRYGAIIEPLYASQLALLDAQRYRKAVAHGVIVLHNGAKACVGKDEADAALDAIAPSPAVAQPVADEREAFEAFAKEKMFDLDSGPHGYTSWQTSMAWYIWQATRKAARAALCQPAEEGGKS